MVGDDCVVIPAYAPQTSRKGLQQMQLQVSFPSHRAVLRHARPHKAISVSANKNTDAITMVINSLTATECFARIENKRKTHLPSKNN